MSNSIKAFEGMGSILARLPFSISLENIYSSRITEDEQYALHDALQVSVSAMIHAREYYELDDEAVEACSHGFAVALTRIFVGAHVEQKRPTETKQADGHIWELVFDPGLKADDLSTDKKGRVWRKVENIDDDFPF